MEVVSVEPFLLRRAQAFPADCGEKGDILMAEVDRDRLMRNVRLLARQLCRRLGFSLTECGNVRLKPDLQGPADEKCQAFGPTALP